VSRIWRLGTTIPVEGANYPARSDHRRSFFRTGRVSRTAPPACRRNASAAFGNPIDATCRGSDPASLSQDVGLALGAQAGEARIRDVVTSAGFSRVSETPFNIVFEARP
jgi:hypothetical protein